MTHVYHDVEASIASYRRAIKSATEQARGNAKTVQDTTYIDLQERFHELLVVAARVAMEAENDGADPAQLSKAMALTIGTLQGQNLLNFLSRGVGDLYQATYMDTVKNIVFGHTPHGTTNEVVRTTQMQGSRA